jgi:hypothetical protein
VRLANHHPLCGFHVALLWRGTRYKKEGHFRITEMHLIFALFSLINICDAVVSSPTPFPTSSDEVDYYDYGTAFCYPGSGYYYGGTSETAEGCWNVCSNSDVTSLVWESSSTGCYCTNEECTCLFPSSALTLLMLTSEDKPSICSYTYSSFSYSYQKVAMDSYSYERVGSYSYDDDDEAYSIYYGDDEEEESYSYYYGDGDDDADDDGQVSKSPVIAPTQVPNPSPSSMPSHKPSYAPTSSPSVLPSPVPTVPPTSEDTTTLAVSLNLAATAEPTQSDKTTLQSTVMSSTGLSASNIRNFKVTYVTARRTKVRRHLLSGTWVVTFDVVISLAASGKSSSTALQSSVESDLKSSSFQTAVTSSIASVSSVGDVTSVVQTRNPSSVPIPAPTPSPSLPPTSKPTTVPSSSPT